MENEEKKEEKELTQEEWRTHLAESFKRLKLPFQPTLTGARGVQLDFCRGVRVFIPPTAPGKYRVVITDLDNDIILYDALLDPDDYFLYKKKYYIRYGVQITEYPSGARILQHRFNAKDRDVLIKIPVETMGDNLAWFGAAVRFKEKHGCNLYVRVADYIRPLLEPAHPDIHFVTYDEMADLTPYAVYDLAIFHNDDDNDYAPSDYRTIPLYEVGDDILGTEKTAEPPKIHFDNKRTIEEPYVCIGSQASGGVKLWHNPQGWESVVDFLKNAGYRVIDIDRDYISGQTVQWNRIPRNAEDMTGNIPLTERAAMIANADFFIGLGSGLSWLAWCVKKDAVVIGGFSQPWEEFPTPYRVYNRNVCHGCFNDVRCVFDHHDYMWCPRHKNTNRHWECSRGITAKSVIDAIKRIPAFQDNATKKEKE